MPPTTVPANRLRLANPLALKNILLQFSPEEIQQIDEVVSHLKEIFKIEWEQAQTLSHDPRRMAQYLKGCTVGHGRRPNRFNLLRTLVLEGLDEKRKLRAIPSPAVLAKNGNGKVNQQNGK